MTGQAPRRLFGTDGIRGTASRAPMDACRPASQACRRFAPLPQRLLTLPHAGPSPLRDAAVCGETAARERRPGPRGRVLAPASGAEPVIRVVAEAEHEAPAE